MGFYSRTLQDYDSEKTVFRIHTTDLNAGNIAAQLTLQANLGSAINNITLGTLYNIRYGNEVVTPGAAPVDPFAQREIKWLIGYRDTVAGGLYTVELGTADLDQLDPNNRNSAHIGDAGVVDQFITDFEAYALSPLGNAVDIEYIRPVGRNL